MTHDGVQPRVTELLAALRAGESDRESELFELVYDELRGIAHRLMARERPGHPLQTTTLLNEACKRLLGAVDPWTWENRRHFFGAAAEAMRRILVETARQRATLRRGGGYSRVQMNVADEATAVADSGDDREELVALDTALRRLEELDPHMAEVVKLRYFAGLTIGQITLVMEVSSRTVDRKWTAARAWLLREMSRVVDAD